MSILREQPISRRSVIAGVFASWALLPRVEATAQNSGKPPTVDLGQGLEIRDYRLFPTDDVMRFIVEIHNTTDTAVDTPAVGVVLPNSGEDSNYAWANPISPVLHPHTSGCLIGIAPAAVKTDEDWEAPEWMLCSELSTEEAEYLGRWDFELNSVLELQDSTTAKSLVRVINKSNEPTAPLSIIGIISDGDRRICGATATGAMPRLPSSETFETGFTISPEYPSVLSPFNLTDQLEDIQISFSVQPRPVPVNAGCGTVMPWNRGG